jgi:Fic family protein
VAFTEKKKRNGKTYYYRTVSVRKGDSVTKERKFLGSDMDPVELKRAEMEADMELGVLEAQLTFEEIEYLEELRKEYQAQPASTERNRYEAFVSLFTHDSTAIEGNTLTLQETASLLFEGISPARGMRDINEVLNHKRAFDYLLEYEGGVSRELVMDLHRLVVQDTLSEDLEDQVGVYRTVQVYIRGVEWVPAAPEDVPRDMASLLSWYSKNRDRLHPFILAIYFHVGFETVHPFIDGNGRVGRLLMNFILRRNDYPMVNIPDARKGEYYEALHEAQVNGRLRPMVLFLLDLLREAKVRL